MGVAAEGSELRRRIRNDAKDRRCVAFPKAGEALFVVNLDDFPPCESKGKWLV